MNRAHIQVNNAKAGASRRQRFAEHLDRFAERRATAERIGQLIHEKSKDGTEAP